MTDSSQFYLGYAHSPPEHVRRWLSRIVPLLLAIAGFALGAFASAQHAFVDSTFAFGTTTTLAGTFVADPYPALLVSVAPTGASGTPAASRIHLVGQGKIGAQVDLASGTAVSVKGTLIARAQQTVLEVVSVTATQAPDTPMLTPTQDLGQVTLEGEIVDSKCHLGVMKPGEGAAHRACAIRCISGGLPPMLVTRRDDGDIDYILISDENGAKTTSAILPYVGKPIRISGALERRNDTLILKTQNNGISLL